jgi:nicotinamide-nucleotide amidase
MNRELLGAIADTMLAKQLKLATAESCTGGWIAKCVTDLAGSSDWFDLAIVSYSNSAKRELLNVSETTLSTQGAVSEQTVCEMVTGVLQRSCADVALAVSGIAGPGGGSADKPVSMVWFAWGWRDVQPLAQVQYFSGDRDQVRQQAVEFALQGLLQRISS